MITRVTMTGADDTVQPADLLRIQRLFPFVEWGILVSANSMGEPRFPSPIWLDTLKKFKRGAGHELNLSLHVCGRWVRQILIGDFTLIEYLTPGLWNCFDRIQLNTHGMNHEFTPGGLMEFNRLWPNKEVIFQHDETNRGLIYSALGYVANMSALFDMSHGAGVMPKTWPRHLDGIRCGYSGGLGPWELETEIPRILHRAEGQPIWIDMETKIRSVKNTFALDRVQSCLITAEPYVVQKIS